MDDTFIAMFLKIFAPVDFLIRKPLLYKSSNIMNNNIYTIITITTITSEMTYWK